LALGGAQLRHQALCLMLLTVMPASGTTLPADVKVEVRKQPWPPASLSLELVPFRSWYDRLQGIPENFSGHYPTPLPILGGYPRRRRCRGSRAAGPPVRPLTTAPRSSCARNAGACAVVLPEAPGGVRPTQDPQNAHHPLGPRGWGSVRVSL